MIKNINMQLVVLPLRVIVVLSALVFALNFCFEIYISYNFQSNKKWVISAVIIFLAVWAIQEAQSIAKNIHSSLVNKLRYLLLLQGCIAILRPAINFLLETSASQNWVLVYGLDISWRWLFLLVYSGLFIAIMDSIIGLFSLNEKNKALQESESRLRRRINLLVEILFELNDDGEIVFSNAAWEKVLGYKLVNGTKLSNYIYPSDLDVFHNTLSNMGIDKESRSNILIRCQHADGHILSMNANLILMESGILGVFQDVTKNIQIQTEADRKEELINDAIESILDAFGLFDAEDKLILCNAKYAQTFTKYNSYDEIKGMSFEELVRSSLKYKGEVIEKEFNGDQEAWIKERIRRHLNPEEVGVTEIHFGPDKWIQVREKCTKNGGIVGIRTDISELKNIQKNLEESIFEKNQLLKSMATLFKSNSMGSMVSSLAHEINGPLGSISINSELLKLELKEKIEKLNLKDFDHFKYIVEQIFEATKKASLVIARLRSLFTHGEDKFELFDLSVILADIYNLMSNEFMNEKITVNLQIENNLMVYGDVSQIQMVVINTLKNSMEALKNISDQKIIKLEARAVDAQTRLEITDNGPGFNNFILKNGFELFKTSKPNGMGVGMWLSRAIMENHNGSINATNSSKGGAIISLIFYDKKNKNQEDRRQGDRRQGG